MLVIAVASLKGGSGKTTLAGHLAVEADRRGAGPVALVDTDPQGGLTEWCNARAATTPHFAQTTRETLARDMQRLQRAGMALVFIDTPPALTETIRDALRLADLVLVPVRPSPHDLRALGATLDLVESLGKPLLFVINGATGQAKTTDEAARLLAQHGTLAPQVLQQRVDYAASMIDGRSAMELPGAARPAEEIAALWRTLRGQLRKLAPAGMADSESAGDREGTPPRERADAGAAPKAAVGRAD